MHAARILFSSTSRVCPVGQFVLEDTHPLIGFGTIPLEHRSHLACPLSGATKLNRHLRHSTEPASENVPLGHGTHVAPFGANVPAGHGVHISPAMSLIHPGRQRHPVVAPAGRIAPNGHGRQRLSTPPLLCRLAGHAWQIPRRTLARSQRAHWMQVPCAVRRKLDGHAVCGIAGRHEDWSGEMAFSPRHGIQRDWNLPLKVPCGHGTHCDEAIRWLPMVPSGQLRQRLVTVPLLNWKLRHSRSLLPMTHSMPGLEQPPQDEEPMVAKGQGEQERLFGVSEKERTGHGRQRVRRGKFWG